MAARGTARAKVCGKEHTRLMPSWQQNYVRSCGLGSKAAHTARHAAYHQDAKLAAGLEGLGASPQRLCHVKRPLTLCVMPAWSPTNCTLQCC